MAFWSRLFGSDTSGKHRAAEERSINFTNWGIPGPAEGGNGSYASTSVELRTAEQSLQTVAVWASTDLISSVGSQLPLDTYRRKPNGQSELIDSPKVVIDPGGDGYGAQDWIYQYLMSKLLRGNAYGREGDRDPATAKARMVTLFHPDTVNGWRDYTSGRPVWYADGRRVDSMWHKRSYPMPGVLLGMSPIEKHVTTIAQSQSAARFGLAWFTEGAHPSMVLRNELVDLNDEQRQQVRTRYLGRGSREPLVMGRGWAKPEALSVKAEESQFLETGRFTAAECCRIFGPNIAEILGYETGGSMTYSNVVDRDLAFLKYTLNRWLTDVEAVFTDLLPRPQFVKFNRGALLEMDLLNRYRAHAVGIGSKFLLPDEARALEDRAPLTPEQKAELAALTVKPVADTPSKGA